MPETAKQQTPAEIRKGRLSRVLRLMNGGWSFSDSNGLSYSLNERGELCYLASSGELAVSGMGFNEFLRKVHHHIDNLPPMDEKGMPK